MRTVARLLGIVPCFVSVAYVPAVGAQDAPRPGVGVTQDAVKPDISLTLSETLNRIPPSGQTRDDIREIPPPRNDRLKDAVRATVVVGTGECLPGEDEWAGQRSFRRGPRLR
jgi:hypothetical protein